MAASVYQNDAGALRDRCTGSIDAIELDPSVLGTSLDFCQMYSGSGIALRLIENICRLVIKRPLFPDTWIRKLIVLRGCQADLW